MAGPPLRKERDPVKRLLGVVQATGGAHFNLLGLLFAPSLPLGDLAPEVAVDAAEFILFSATRGNPGTSGTTTVRLQKNGQPVENSELSWTSDDPANTLQGRFITVFVERGDRLSLELLSVEDGASELLARLV